MKWVYSMKKEIIYMILKIENKYVIIKLRFWVERENKYENYEFL